MACNNNFNSEKWVSPMTMLLNKVLARYD